MKVSLNTLRLTNKWHGSAGDPAPDGTEALIEKIGAQLGAVDEALDFGSRFKDVVVAKVASCQDHPNADRLHVCKLDDGGKIEGVERDENGHVQVVCGAPNVREGLMVAWLPPGATVPESLVKGEPFVLEARPLRGIVSNGMLASPRELTIGDSHEGILEVDVEVEPGTLFAEAYNLTGDIIIDIENKMFTHRPDCFGMLGVAREIEGIQHRPYKSPGWYNLKPHFPEKGNQDLPLVVKNELPDLVSRFMAVAMSNVRVAKSPVWLQIYLSKVGVRPINNIVDYTNFFMLETGQPLHAYDYDKVLVQDSGATAATLKVRYPDQANNETLTLLNGKTITPRPEAIMIATDKKLIGIGGVMGGADCEVDANTQNIILECANFDMYSIRRTSMAHGLFTDAVTRNNKGQSPLQNPAVLAKIVQEIAEFAGGQIASDIIDDNHLEVAIRDRGALHAPVKVGAEFINLRLGISLDTEQIATLLRNVEFKVDIEADDIIVTAPFWRTDIEIAEDIVEEVGRLYGFDRLSQKLPNRDITPASPEPMLQFKSRLRNILSQAGANEVLTYSFVHGKLLDVVGQDKNHAYQLANALSPDLQYYRMSLTPSLLDKVHSNIKAGINKLAIFEINKTHTMLSVDETSGLPIEMNSLSLVVAENDTKANPSSGATYFLAKTYLDFVADELGVKLTYTPATEGSSTMVKPYDISRSAFVSLSNNPDQIIGIVGELKAGVRKQLKLPAHTAAFELDVERLFVNGAPGKRYQQLPRFPKVEQDICLKVDESVGYSDLYNLTYQTVQGSRDDILFDITPVDIYQRENDPRHKQITLRLSIASFEKTLRDEEVALILDEVATKANQEFSAMRV